MQRHAEFAVDRDGYVPAIGVPAGAAGGSVARLWSLAGYVVAFVPCKPPWMRREGW